MNEDSRRSQILKFLKGKEKKSIDAYCIYQWIESCHYYEWWDLGIKLSVYIPPNSLKADYHKRLDFLLLECRRFNMEKVKESEPVIKEMVNKIIALEEPQRERIFISLGILNREDSDLLKKLYFENSAKETLRHIYSVLYCMKKFKYTFSEAAKASMNVFEVRYQTVVDKCGRRFADTVDNFTNWYQSGLILQKLNEKFVLSDRDYQKFAELLSES